MAAYLYPELPSKSTYKKALSEGKEIIARENTPFGSELVQNGEVVFEGPHFPKPHRYYGMAVVQDGKVVKVK